MTRPIPETTVGRWARWLADNPWRALAACGGHDPEAWFPPGGTDASDALSVCAGCPVRVDCARAGRHERYGIWGGQRRRGR